MPRRGVQKSDDAASATPAAAVSPSLAPGVPSPGPHAALGTIDYDGGQTGQLLYIKSSLSGDENDYVRDYARRYDQFPHESTGDQFFSEEQFEVYRALGFHIASRLLSGEDKLQVSGLAGARRHQRRRCRYDRGARGDARLTEQRTTRRAPCRTARAGASMPFRSQATL